eukprot:TRINITY_DN59789_c0_g1_i1.p1 TRINITY_DN59789_c0_g1~~TRINITY_DN59789_c0_g1_i1.p1  ORF type:complete len:246 (-),score=30.85 TRINITY_DN59789_c0_g1_i1:374-1111(-)
MSSESQIVVPCGRGRNDDKPLPLGLKVAKRLRDGEPFVCVESIASGQILKWNSQHSLAKQVRPGDVLVSIRSGGKGLQVADSPEQITKITLALRALNAGNAQEEIELTFQRGTPQNCNLEKPPPRAAPAEGRKAVGDSGRCGDSSSGVADDIRETRDIAPLDKNPSADGVAGVAGAGTGAPASEAAGAPKAPSKPRQSSVPPGSAAAKRSSTSKGPAGKKKGGGVFASRTSGKNATAARFAVVAV